MSPSPGPQAAATPRIDAATLRRRLAGDDELALLDVREQGVHYRGHPFFACSAPLSRIELVVGALVPRRDAPVVLLDGGDEGLAERAAAVLGRLGYTDVAILEGGCRGWQADGGELFSGVNVPSKAFGEFVEHHEDTPRMPPDEVAARIAAGEKILILDSRPFDEYHRMNIPGGIAAPGAELVWRVHDLAQDPDTLVVVNCAGRTRSIIGCQSLRNAGIPNRVVALKDGTMGWELAGHRCERGATREAPMPGPAAAARARSAAQRVAERYRVRFVDRASVQRWQRDPDRTLYLLDVRSPAEFAAAHIAGSRHAPGGQLVQATDEYLAVRAGRIVLVDPERVRSVMTASWLNQMGLPEVYVLEPEGDDGFAGWPLAQGGADAPSPALAGWAEIAPDALAARLGEPGLAVLDLASSLRHRTRHVAGAWWAVRARLAQARERVSGDAGPTQIVITADEPALAQLAAPEAAALWPDAEVCVLAGGNRRWFDGHWPVEAGLDRITTEPDDVWYKPYDHACEYERHAREYLEWEVGLVEQIRRDPTVRFRRY